MCCRLLILLVAAALVGPARASDVVDGVVAVVGDQPLMLSTVLFEQEVRSVQAEGGRSVNLGPPRPDPAVLEAMIDHTLVLQEAEGEIIGVTEEANWQLQLLLDRFERREDLTRWLDRWSIGTAELRAYFVAEVRVDVYATARAETTTRLSDREVREAYTADPDRWGGAPFEQVEQDIRAELWSTRLATQRQQWLETVRQRRGARYTDLGKSVFGEPESVPDPGAG